MERGIIFSPDKIGLTHLCRAVTVPLSCFRQNYIVLRMIDFGLTMAVLPLRAGALSTKTRKPTHIYREVRREREPVYRKDFL